MKERFNFRRTVLKIAAVGISTAMVGATIFGASAVAGGLSGDLKNYPGTLKADGVKVVIGDAAHADVAAATDVGKSLGLVGFSSTTASSSSSSSSVDISKGTLLQRSDTDALFPGRAIGNIYSSGLTKTDFPAMLKDGKFVDQEGTNTVTEEFTQTLEVGNNSGTAVDSFQFRVDADDDGDKKVGWYARTAKNSQLINFSAKPKNGMTYSNDTSSAAKTDFLGVKVEGVLGTDMYFVDAAVSSSGALNKVSLVAGTSLTLEPGVPTQISLGNDEYTLGVKIGTSSQCTVDVDGQSQVLSEGATKAFGKVEVSVVDVFAQHEEKGGACVVVVNEKDKGRFTLESGARAKRGDTFITDSVSTVETGAGVDRNKFTGLSWTVNAGDEFFLGSATDGSVWDDPISGTFSLYLEPDLTDEDLYGEDGYALVDFSGGSRTGYLKFREKGGSWVDMPLARTSAGNILWSYVIGVGPDYSDTVLTPQDQGLNFDCNTDTTSTGTTAATDCEGLTFVYVDTDERVSLLRITNIDTVNKDVDIKIVSGHGEGDVFTDVTYTENTTSTITTGLGSFTAVINYNGTIAFNDTQADGPAELYKRAAVLTLNSSYDGQPANFSNSIINNVSANFTEDAGGRINSGTARTWSYFPGYDDTESEITAITNNRTTPTLINHDAWLSSGQVEQFDRTKPNNVWGNTAWGTWYENPDTTENTKLTLKIPIKQPAAKMYILPVTAVKATTSTGAASTATTFTNLGAAAVLASEVADVTAENLIIVGGPCANAAWEKAGGENCAAAQAAWAPDKAVIKLVEHASGKVAILVAGYEAADTKRATDKLAAGGLTGTEVAVVKPAPTPPTA